MNKINQLIFVLGMHRSGTSAATRLINILGAEVGRNLLLGNTEVNKKGFWENRALIDLHDDLLTALDAAWFDFRRLPDLWWQREDIRPFAEKILKILERDFNRFDLMVLKDPRISRLLPIWLDALEGIARRISCLIVLRNPLEVINSLTVRDGFNPELSAFVWLAYVLDAEYYSRDFARSFTQYDKILYDWEAEIQSVAAEMKITWPNHIDAVRHEITQEIDPNLRHHNASHNFTEEIGRIAQVALNVYKKLSSDDHGDLSGFMDKVKAELYDTAKFGDTLADMAYRTTVLLNRKTGEHSKLESEYRALKEQHQRLSQENLDLSNTNARLLNTLQQHWSRRIAVRCLRLAGIRRE